MSVVSPGFWLGIMLVGVGLLVFGKKANLLSNTVFAVIVSVLILAGYFHLVNHYLMDMQGLDYWYLFRK
jgi:hypothetical protein